MLAAMLPQDYEIWSDYFLASRLSEFYSPLGFGRNWMHFSNSTKEITYLTDTELWAAREVHILTGDSGVGKSTVMAQWINCLTTGEGELVGLRAKPVGSFNPLYISLERSHKSLMLEPWGLKCPVMDEYMAVEGLGLPPKQGLNFEVLKKICEKYAGKGHRVICFDPLAFFCPKPNDAASVRQFLVNTVKQICEPMDVTIIGTGHPAKEREGNRVLGVRSKIAGSYGWGAFSNCVMFMSKTDPDDFESTDSQIQVMARRIKPFVTNLERGPEGWVEVENKEEVKEAAKIFVLDSMLDGKERITTAEALNGAIDKKVSPRTVYRWLNRLEKEGRLVELGRGEYKIQEVENGVTTQ